MEFFLNNKVQKKSRVLSDICLPSSLCTHLHDSVCKKQKYLSSSFTKSRRNSIVSARSQQVFSIHSLFCSTEKRENLWTISQGCWTWCAEQKVNSLSKHMLYFSSRANIFKIDLCISNLSSRCTIVPGGNLGQARTKAERRQSFASKIHNEGAREREMEDMLYWSITLEYQSREIAVHHQKKMMSVLLCWASES